MHGGMLHPHPALHALLPELGRRTAIMGILNLTPDSFSDGGRYQTSEVAIEAGVRMVADGADLVDLGGESTRPGSKAVPLEEELARVLPVIRGLVARGVAAISIDTNKAEVARQAVAAGATMINDISALGFDPDMAKVVAEAGVPVVLSHTRGRPEVMQQGELSYAGGVVAGVRASLAASVAIAEAAGVQRSNILLDPGIGFGKTVEDNTALLAGLRDLSDWGAPILIGTSRKSFIGALTGQPVDQRELGTAASVACAIAHGADVVRVHDVAAARDVVRVADAIERPHA